METEQSPKRDLAERLFKFAVDTIKATRKLPKSPEYKVITYQLIKAASSSGANYEEAQAAVSKADFSNKIGISLKETREANYWIRIVLATLDDAFHSDWLPLEKESVELKAILASIYNKVKKERSSK